ncbi:MAG: hypothetical protein GXO87_13380, partial [Chlorobi bacterium]|nr:hypothetical protein [Chlorobiota bacterium]
MLNGKNLIQTAIMLFALNATFFAQETTIKLPTTDNTSSFNVTKRNNFSILKLNADGGFYVQTDIGIGTIPITGAGRRLMWYAAEAAFRSGYVTGTQWDDSNIGQFSTAMGYNTIASGYTTTAIGNGTTASGDAATAIGAGASAGGYHSTAIGDGTNASGTSSTAIGKGTTASGTYSTAIGKGTTASGSTCIAMGQGTTASGIHSTAIGNYVSTNGKNGALAIGDFSTYDIMDAYADNMMIARFAGGYTFYSNNGLSAGVTVAPGGNSWGSASDSTKKENVLLADGEYFLNSIAKLRLGSWNYKGQDPKDFRHYGPMAQEIFQYFGKDKYGTIGCDTLLA